MDSNTHSTQPPDQQPVGPPDDDLAALTVALDRLATRDLDQLPHAVRAERVLVLEQLADRLDGQRLKELAGVDALGAAGAEAGQEFGSTAAWLRNRLHLSDRVASSQVRTARALFRGPLTETAQALTEGAISVAHAAAVAHGTRDLPDHVTAEAEPVLVEAARRLDPTRLRRLLGHLVQVADPDSADHDRERRHQRRGLWLAPTFEGMVAVDGLLEPEAGQTLLAALEPLARPADATDTRSGSQRNADALTELARRHLEGGRLPQAGGVRPQLAVTVDLDSLLGHPNAVGGEIGWAGPLDPEACRRLACDGAVTRVLVTRHPSHHPGHGANVDRGPASPDPSGVEGLDAPPVADDPGGKAPPATHDPNPEAQPEPHHPTAGTTRTPPPQRQGTTDTSPPQRRGATRTPPTRVGPTGWRPASRPP